MLSAGTLSFLAYIGIVLTFGMIAGMATTASVKIPPDKRVLVFGAGTVGFVEPLAFFFADE